MGPKKGAREKKVNFFSSLRTHETYYLGAGGRPLGGEAGSAAFHGRARNVADLSASNSSGRG